ncbi:hypothetical protein BCR34DRAFT_603362 [Clohesyomyces aquaticus]|uniref:Uncharacterized protein n=1 Tax=Clohesyomyces aquaticus TaxID=1231657 RepID=A0A1Y1ZFG8_9PLEO|nr:hypothetical protein BCR34DRAFT_603362 [Clohesyomyces aquaticus]
MEAERERGRHGRATVFLIERGRALANNATWKEGGIAAADGNGSSLGKETGDAAAGGAERRLPDCARGEGIARIGRERAESVAEQSSRSDVAMLVAPRTHEASRARWGFRHAGGEEGCRDTHTMDCATGSIEAAQRRAEGVVVGALMSSGINSEVDSVKGNLEGAMGGRGKGHGRAGLPLGGTRWAPSATPQRPHSKFVLEARLSNASRPGRLDAGFELLSTTPFALPLGSPIVPSAPPSQLAPHPLHPPACSQSDHAQAARPSSCSPLWPAASAACCLACSRGAEGKQAGKLLKPPQRDAP